MIPTNKNDLRLWYYSVACLVAAIIPFVLFMFKMKLGYLIVALAAISGAVAFYLTMNKKITHPKLGYTAFQAIELYKKGCEAGFVKSKNCRDNRKAFEEFCKNFSFTENLDFNQMIEMYATGQKLVK